jgi:hypothetical protein
MDILRISYRLMDMCQGSSGITVNMDSICDNYDLIPANQDSKPVRLRFSRTVDQTWLG